MGSWTSYTFWRTGTASGELKKIHFSWWQHRHGDTIATVTPFLQQFTEVEHNRSYTRVVVHRFVPKSCWLYVNSRGSISLKLQESSCLKAFQKHHIGHCEKQMLD